MLGLALAPEIGIAVIATVSPAKPETIQNQVADRLWIATAAEGASR
jgi:hypothetical protein